MWFAENILRGREGHRLESAFILSHGQDSELYLSCWERGQRRLTLNLCVQQRIAFPHRVWIRLSY